MATAEGRLSSLETKVNLLIALAVILVGAAGAAYWKLWDIGRDLGSLSSRVDGYDNEAILKLLSSVQTDGKETPAVREMKRAVEKILGDTIQKNQQGQPVPSGLYYELGIFSAKNGKLEDAVTYFQQAVQLNPLDYRAFSSLGASYIDLGEKNPERRSYYATKAIEPLMKAVEINPNHAKAHNNLGIAYHITDQRDAAIREWNTAIKIDPNFEAPLYNFACMYGSEGHTQEALQYLEEAVVNRGFDNLATIEADEERCFSGLRGQSKFIQLKNSIRQRKQTAVVR